MCGRARLSSDVSEIKVAFRIPPERPSPNFAASWNVAPTDPVPVVRYDAEEHQRSLEVMRWGLVPFWAKDIKVGFANINAMAEAVEASRPFATHSSGVAVWRRLMASTNGKNRHRQADRCDCSGRPTSDGLGRPMGELALSSGRMDTQLRDHHDGSERAVRRDPQPHDRRPGRRGSARSLLTPPG